MDFPNTFLIGMPKSGTTSLANAMASHSSICLTTPKETGYFWMDYHKSKSKFMEVYCPHYLGEPILLEASTSNAAIKYVESRIKECSPKAKIIMSIREPIERAYSHWWMIKNYMPGKIHDCFEREMERNIQTFGFFNTETELDIIPYVDPKGGILKSIIIEQGLYATFYDRYSKAFGRDNVKVVLFDDIIIDSHTVLAGLYNFLGVKNIKTKMKTENKRSLEYTEETQLHKLYSKYDVVRRMTEIYTPQIHQISNIIGRDLIKLWGYDRL